MIAGHERVREASAWAAGDRRADVLRPSVAEHRRDRLLRLRRGVLSDWSRWSSDAEVDLEIGEIQDRQRVELSPNRRSGVVRGKLGPKERLRRSRRQQLETSTSIVSAPSSSSVALE